MKNRCLITGGAGFIGSALANSLLQTGDTEVICIDNLSTGTWKRLDPRIKKMEIDLASASQQDLEKLLSDVDVLFHLAAVKLHNTNNSFQSIIETNVKASHRLFEAAGVAGVRSVVFTSSLYTYGLPKESIISESVSTSPATIYGASKLFGENLLSIAAQKFNFKYSIARLFFIYGENQYAEGGYKSVIVSNFERLSADTPAIINGNGEQTLDYLHVSDCVRALISLAKSPLNEVFNVSSGIPLTINELNAEMLKLVPDGKSIYAPKDWTHGTRRVGSFEKINSLIGWSPQISLKEGLARTWMNLK